jgi:hypothetical protein
MMIEKKGFLVPFDCILSECFDDEDYIDVVFIKRPNRDDDDDDEPCSKRRKVDPKNGYTFVGTEIDGPESRLYGENDRPTNSLKQSEKYSQSELPIVESQNMGQWPEQEETDGIVADIPTTNREKMFPDHFEQKLENRTRIDIRSDNPTTFANDKTVLELKGLKSTNHAVVEDTPISLTEISYSSDIEEEVDPAENDQIVTKNGTLKKKGSTGSEIVGDPVDDTGDLSDQNELDTDSSLTNADGSSIHENEVDCIPNTLSDVNLEHNSQIIVDRVSDSEQDLHDTDTHQDTDNEYSITQNLIEKEYHEVVFPETIPATQDLFDSQASVQIVGSYKLNKRDTPKLSGMTPSSPIKKLEADSKAEDSLGIEYSPLFSETGKPVQGIPKRVSKVPTSKPPKNNIPASFLSNSKRKFQKLSQISASQPAQVAVVTPIQHVSSSSSNSTSSSDSDDDSSNSDEDILKAGKKKKRRKSMLLEMAKDSSKEVT